MPQYHQGWRPPAVEEIESFELSVTQYQSSPLFSDVAPHLKGSGDGKLSLPYKSVLKFFPGAFADESQTTGDCTSHGTRNAVDTSRAVEIDIKGEPETWLARTATEPQYGYRGYSGQGMSVSRGCEWFNKFGMVARGKYGSIDLSKYDSSIGTRWGSAGVPEEIKVAAKKHPCRYLAYLKTTREIVDAVANGFGVAIGSNQGFANRRDSNGIATPSGSWSHCMSIIGCDDTKTIDGETLFLIANSWGKWNEGGQPDWGTIPDGSFLARESTVNRMLGQGETIVVGDVDGYPPRTLPDYGHGGWM